MEYGSRSTELLGGSLRQFDLERDDSPCGSVDKKCSHLSDGLPVSRNYCSSSKQFIRNLHCRSPPAPQQANHRTERPQLSKLPRFGAMISLPLWQFTTRREA